MSDNIVRVARCAAQAAASGSMMRLSSKRSRTNAAFGESPNCQLSTSSSREFQTSGERTTVPRRGVDSTSPLPASSLSASRSAGRAIDNCRASSVELGSVVPGLNSPDTIRRPMCSAAMTCLAMRRRGLGCDASSKNPSPPRRRLLLALGRLLIRYKYYLSGGIVKISTIAVRPRRAHRHCERSEANQRPHHAAPGLLRHFAPRNDERSRKLIFWLSPKSFPARR